MQGQDGGSGLAAGGFEHERDLQRLGQALHARTDEVVTGMLTRSKRSGVVLEDVVEDSFARVGAVSTIAVARWMAGEGAGAAREVGQESWSIFGQLAAQRAAPLNEVTKRCLRWRDAAEDLVREASTQLQLSPEARGGAGMLQRSLDVTLVRMCQSFEAERKACARRALTSSGGVGFLVTHDSLTGLPNRTLILDRVEQMLGAPAERGRHRGAVHRPRRFQVINDTLGHDAGDQLLRAVRARLTASCASRHARRLGGDEFVVADRRQSARRRPRVGRRTAARRARAAVRARRAPRRLPVTASVGIASATARADDLLRDADIALYRGEAAGKNRYVVFQPGMQDAVADRLELEIDLRPAFERDEFFLVYQPIFDLRTRASTGVEALIRWHHPTRASSQPDDSSRSLEETGLIVAVGRWVCARPAARRRSGARRDAARRVGQRLGAPARR